VPPDIPYGHMGATICDAILQAGLKWETVVKPRLENLRRDHSSVATTSNFFNLIKEVGLKELLDWRDDEKPTRIRGITEFFVQEGVETESELKVWLKNENNEARLKRQKGVGNKTADYFKLLVGIPTTAVDRHMIKFLKLAGVDVADYAQAKEIIHRTADLMELNRTVLDHSIWKFMSQGKSRNLCKSTRKNIYRGSANKIVSHGGKVLIKHPSNGAPRASPWSPKTIPTYANLPAEQVLWQAGASVGHPLVSEIRRSTVDPSLKGFLSRVTHSSTAKAVVSCVGG